MSRATVIEYYDKSVYNRTRTDVKATSYRLYPEGDLCLQFCYRDELEGAVGTVTIAISEGRCSVAPKDMTPDDPSVVHKADYMLYFSQKPFSNSDF